MSIQQLSRPINFINPLDLDIFVKRELEKWEQDIKNGPIISNDIAKCFSISNRAIRENFSQFRIHEKEVEKGLTPFQTEQVKHYTHLRKFVTSLLPSLREKASVMVVGAQFFPGEKYDPIEPMIEIAQRVNELGGTLILVDADIDTLKVHKKALKQAFPKLKLTFFRCDLTRNFYTHARFAFEKSKNLELNINYLRKMLDLALRLSNDPIDCLEGIKVDLVVSSLVISELASNFLHFMQDGAIEKVIVQGDVSEIDEVRFQLERIWRSAHVKDLFKCGKTVCLVDSIPLHVSEGLRKLLADAHRETFKKLDQKAKKLSSNDWYWMSTPTSLYSVTGAVYQQQL